MNSHARVTELEWLGTTYEAARHLLVLTPGGFEDFYMAAGGFSIPAEMDAKARGIEPAGERALSGTLLPANRRELGLCAIASAVLAIQKPTFSSWPQTGRPALRGNRELCICPAPKVDGDYKELDEVPGAQLKTGLKANV